jgi:UDP-N-acetyl-D-glucosamine dehydrogenase
MSDRIERLKGGDITFGVVGLGYVGLPLALEVGQAGINALGFDISPQVVAGISAGRSHIQDISDEAVAACVAAGKLSATTDMSRLAECDAISICVPTPLNKTRDPDVSYILAVGQAIAETLTPGQLIVLESTTYPGTTSEILLPLFEASGLRVGEDFFLCFSPERVDPGNEVWHTKNTPKVIGGVTETCLAAGVAVYERFIDSLVPVSSPEASEMVKLLENTFRAVNIALVNEIAMISDRLDVNVWEVIEAAGTKPFGFMKFTPGPGLGGHCIPIDPHYLSWKMRTMDYKTRFIELASEINTEMPGFVVDKVREALNRHRKSVNGTRILILGVAYKPNIDDVRETPAMDIVTRLHEEGAEILYHEPYVPNFSHNDLDLESVDLSDEVLSEMDAVVIVTDHAGIDYLRVVELASVVVDARNVVSRQLYRSGGETPTPAWIVKA